MQTNKLLIFIGLLAIGKPSYNQDTSAIAGAYRMTRQIANDGVKDTLLKQEQLKLYTYDKYMIYASPRATDSFGEYGIAKYRVEGDKVIENIFYTSAAGEVSDSATLSITQIPNGYRQIINYSDSNGTFVLTEDYKRVGKNIKTPLDGAWKQVRNMFITKSGDTSYNQVTQFKVYQSGYFIWANPSKDPSSNNFVTSYGYGTFKMAGKNASQEININSTYNFLVGRPVKIKIEMISENGYKQTITHGNGDRSIEVYERLK